MSVSIDLSQVDRLVADLGRAPARVVPETRRALSRAGVQIKTDARSQVSGHPSWKRIGRYINYDLRGLTLEVGYDDTGQGELAGIYEFGSVRRAPHLTLRPAFDREIPKTLNALADVLAKAMS